MAGCIIDRDIFKISYNNLSSEIASQHADWTPHQVRVEAARLFRPSYHQNMESAKHEVGDEKEYPGASFVFENGEVNFIDGLKMTNILTFHENQLRDTPEKYSREQHETSLLIQTAFQNGATEVVTSYLEPNGQRDIVVMTLDRATGKGKMRIINTLNDHTMEEMRALVKNNFSHLSEAHPVANAFILSDTHIPKERIQQKIILPDQKIHVVLKEPARVAKTTIREMRHTTDSMKQFVQQLHNDGLKVHSDVTGDSFIHHIRRVFVQKEDKKGEVAEVKKHEINLFGHVSERVKNTQRKIQEKITSSVDVLLFVRATGVGIGGTFEFLHATLRPPDSSVDPAKRSKKEILWKQNHTSEKTRVLRTEQHVLYRKEKILRKKEKKVLRRKERSDVRKKEKILWEIVRKLMKKGKTIERKSFVKTVNRKEIIKKLRVENRDKKVKMISKERNSQKQEKQRVMDISVALVIWLLLQMQSSSRPTKEIRSTLIVNKREKSKTLPVKDPAPWLLFALIWHLAMIREQGARRGLNDPRYMRQTVQKQKMIQRAVLPPMGIIFAFAS